MRNIEEHIQNNLNSFNSEMPRKGHDERFLQKLNNVRVEKPEGWFTRNNVILRIAAAIILFAGIGSLYYITGFSGLNKLLTNQIVERNLPPEVQEVVRYYAAITTKKIGQIDDLAVSENQAVKIKAMANEELNSLEKDRKDLEAEYSRNPENERVTDALLLNRKKQSEVLDRILSMLQ